MTKNEFINLIGQDVVVDYPFMGKNQQWSMLNFEYDPTSGEIRHKRLALIIDAFISNARNPHKGKATHG